MFQYFKWSIHRIQDKIFLNNDLFGLEVSYGWDRLAWEFFLFSYFDDNKKTFSYFAFDDLSQKNMFDKVIKISGIWAKTAFQIVQFSLDEINIAIKELDVRFFQNIPGIGLKTAKKLLLELKDSIDVGDFKQIDMDNKLYKNIVNSLKSFGYEASQIKQALQDYDGTVSKENMWDVVKWIIGQM